MLESRWPGIVEDRDNFSIESCVKIGWGSAFLSHDVNEHEMMERWVRDVMHFMTDSAWAKVHLRS